MDILKSAGDHAILQVGNSLVHSSPGVDTPTNIKSCCDDGLQLFLVLT